MSFPEPGPEATRIPDGAPAPAPPRKGMSTGGKVAIGCGILGVLALVAIVAAVVAGGMFVKNKAEDLTGGLEAQAEAQESIDRLERERPFTPPADGIVGEERAEKFFAVTDAAWEEVGDRVDDMVERAEDIEESGSEPGLRDAMAGLQGFGAARSALAGALVDEEMPVSEYLWTGLVLLRAYEFLETPAGGGVPPENLALADAHRAELAEIAEGEEDGRPDKTFILATAWTLGANQTAISEALGLDTLGVAPGAP